MIPPPPSIDEFIPHLPSDIQAIILDETQKRKSEFIISRCDHWFRRNRETNRCLRSWPDPKHPWYTPISPCNARWTALFYVYLWYLLNRYHMPIIFDPRLYRSWRGDFDWYYFDKFWNLVFGGEDWRMVANGRSERHPFPGGISYTVICIVKLNYNDRPTSVLNPATLEWIRNEDGSFHSHSGYESNEWENMFCQKTIWRAGFLNTGIPYSFDEMATTPEATVVEPCNPYLLGPTPSPITQPLHKW